MKTVILIRKLDGLMRPYWKKYGEYDSRAMAEAVYSTYIKGKGITAWAELVTPEEAKAMMQ